MRTNLQELITNMMDEKAFTKRVLITVAIIVVVAIVLFLSIRAAGLIVLVFAAWITAETADILVRYLMRRKMKRGLAVAITILVALLVISALLTIVLPPVIRELVALLRQVEDLPALIRGVIDDYESFRQVNEIAHLILPPASQDLQTLLLGENGQGSLIISAAEQAIPVITNVGTYVGLTIGQGLLYLFLTVLLMLEPTIYYDAFLRLIPSNFEQRASEILNLVRKNVESWSGAMLLSMALTSVLYFLFLGVILGLPNALALSAIAGIATIIPTVGNTLALIPVIIVSAQMGWPTLIAAVILYAVVGTVQDRIITPSIMRSELSIPAAAQVIFQLVLSSLIGPLGLLLAIPLLAISITLVRELYVVDVLGKKPATVDNAPAPEKATDEDDSPDDPVGDTEVESSEVLGDNLNS